MIMENYLNVETKEGPMDIFTCAPEGDQKLPVVIVLQEAFGVNHHIKDVCQRLAGEGYLVLAPELYHRVERHLSVSYTDREKIFPLLQELTNEALLHDLEATIHFVWSLPRADIRNVFTMGFCMGGFTSLLAATHFPLRGAISFYGGGVVNKRKGIGFSPILNQLPDSKSPLLLFFGESDASIPESDRFAIRKVLDEAHVPHEMHVFGEADHGFFCDERKTYHQVAAKAAWKKSLEWMKQLQCH
jgi:carboxymethylenebutenolidase